MRKARLTYACQFMISRSCSPCVRLSRNAKLYRLDYEILCLILQKGQETGKVKPASLRSLLLKLMPNICFSELFCLSQERVLSCERIVNTRTAQKYNLQKELLLKYRFLVISPMVYLDRNEILGQYCPHWSKSWVNHKLPSSR